MCEKRKVVCWIGGIVTFLLAGLLHFVYEWSGNQFVVGLFGAVNESVWEHMKIFAFAYLIWSVVQYFLCKEELFSYLRSTLRGLAVIMAVIPVVFYTYTGILGTNLFLLDLATGALATAIAFRVSCKRKENHSEKTPNKFITLLGLALLIAALLSLTRYPLKIGLFEDPLTGEYGYAANPYAGQFSE